MKNEEIIGELINFFAVAFLFIIGISIVFRIFCKRFKFNNKNIELYGLLLHLDTPSLISISAATINYLFLVWWMISFQGLHVIYIAVTLVLVILGDAVIDNFKGLFVSFLLTIVNCIGIQVIYMMYDYLSLSHFSWGLVFVLFLVILFVFLYYTYYLFRNINNIAVRGKYLRGKKYDV